MVTKHITKQSQLYPTFFWEETNCSTIFMLCAVVYILIFVMQCNSFFAFTEVLFKHSCSGGLQKHPRTRKEKRKTLQKERKEKLKKDKSEDQPQAVRNGGCFSLRKTIFLWLWITFITEQYGGKTLWGEFLKILF